MVIHIKFSLIVTKSWTELVSIIKNAFLASFYVTMELPIAFKEGQITKILHRALYRNSSTILAKTFPPYIIAPYWYFHYYFGDKDKKNRFQHKYTR